MFKFYQRDIIKAGTPLFVEAYLNRNSRFVDACGIPSDSALDVSQQKNESHCLVFSNIWLPRSSGSWSWRPSVVTVFIGSLAANNIALEKTVSLPHQLSSRGTLKIAFNSVWKYLRHEIDRILGYNGSVPVPCVVRYTGVSCVYKLRHSLTTEQHRRCQHQEKMILSRACSVICRAVKTQNAIRSKVVRYIRAIVTTLTSRYIQRRWELVHTSPTVHLSLADRISHLSVLQTVQRRAERALTQRILPLGPKKNNRKLVVSRRMREKRLSLFRCLRLGSAEK